MVGSLSSPQSNPLATRPPRFRFPCSSYTSLDSLVSVPSTFATPSVSPCYDGDAYIGNGSVYDPFVCSPCATLFAMTPDETQRA